MAPASCKSLGFFLLLCCVLWGHVLMGQFHPGALESAIDEKKVIILYILSVIQHVS